MAAAASRTTSLAVARRFPSDRSKRAQLEIEPEHSGIEHPQRLIEQLLPGLVTVADDDLAAGRHAVQSRAKCRRRASTLPDAAQTHALRVGGMPLRPSGPGTTPSTWWMEIPPSSNPLADAAM